METKSFKISFGEESFDALYVKDLSKAKHALAYLASRPGPFGVDIETAAKKKYAHNSLAALSPLLSDIRLLQVFDGKFCVVFDWLVLSSHLKHDVLDFLSSRNFIAHNAIFELQFFKKLGLKHMDIGCSMIMAKLLFHATYPTDAGLNAGLDDLCKVFFKIPLAKHVQNSNWGEPDLNFEQVQYAALDAVATLRLGQKLIKGIKKFELQRVYKLCKDAQHPITELQLNGLGINTDLHKEYIIKWRQRLYEVKKSLLEMTGLKKITGHTLAKYLEDNLDEKHLNIWPRTETGKLSTDSHTFADFDFLPIVAPFSEFQKLDKLCSSFGSSLDNLINENTNRLHAQYRITGTRTGRLSCTKPNLQQLPRDKGIRSMFIPKYGRTFLCADYNQVELRVAAELSRDVRMLDAYKKGIDLHALTASVVSHKPLEMVTEQDRQMAKAVNFGFLFGLGAKKFSHYAKKSYKVDVSEDDAEDAVRAFRSTYAGYRKWQLRQVDVCSGSRTVRTPCGKLRKLPEDNTYGTSMNTPVQGGAAEIMLHALIYLDEYIRDSGIDMQLVNCVHDEILCECDPEEQELGKELIALAMVEGFKAVFPDGITNGLVEVNSGINWADAKKKPEKKSQKKAA